MSYHLDIFIVILILSASHWSEEVLRWRKWRILRLPILASDDAYDGDAVKASPVVVTSLDDGSKPSSSGSSTLEGTASPPRKDIDEETPLLPIVPKHRRTITSSFRSFLMYQPGPIPLFN